MSIIYTNTGNGYSTSNDTCKSSIETLFAFPYQGGPAIWAFPNSVIEHVLQGSE